MCCSGPQGAAAHSSAQLGFEGAASEQTASERGLTLMSTRLGVTPRRCAPSTGSCGAQTEPQNRLGSRATVSQTLQRAAQWAKGSELAFRNSQTPGLDTWELPPLLPWAPSKPGLFPRPGEDSRAGSSRRIRSSVFHQGPLPRHQHPPVMMLREELHGAVGQDHLVRLHLQGSQERESRQHADEGRRGQRQEQWGHGEEKLAQRGPNSSGATPTWVRGLDSRASRSCGHHGPYPPRSPHPDLSALLENHRVRARAQWSSSLPLPLPVFNSK